MAMEEDLIARLVADAGVSAVVGEAVSWFARNRIDAYPALILSMISPGRDYDHGGADGLDSPRIQFDCYGTTDEQTVALKRAVIACMEQAATVGDTRFWPAFLETETMFNEGEQETDGGTPLFRIALDFTFHHEET